MKSTETHNLADTRYATFLRITRLIIHGGVYDDPMVQFTCMLPVLIRRGFVSRSGDGGGCHAGSPSNDYSSDCRSGSGSGGSDYCSGGGSRREDGPRSG